VRGHLPTRPGATPYDTRPTAGIVGLTVHYTASAVAAGLSAVEAVARYQSGLLESKPKTPFPAIAYTMVVDGAGTVYLCHNPTTRVWHSGAVIGGVSRNISHASICWIGNTQPTAAQIVGLARGIVWQERSLGRHLPLEGHRDAPYSTSCPGPAWPGWRVALELEVGRRRLAAV
jgi:hypothetical protein